MKRTGRVGSNWDMAAAYQYWSTHECSQLFPLSLKWMTHRIAVLHVYILLSIIFENTLLSISVERFLIFQFLLDSTVSNSYLERIYVNLRSIFSFQRELISVLGKVSRKELELRVWKKYISALWHYNCGKCSRREIKVPKINVTFDLGIPTL